MTSFPGVMSRAAEAIKRQAVSLRPYQQKIEDGVLAHWAAGAANVLAVTATGGGKTRVFCSILSKHQGAAVAIAHRQELVAQISLTLNSFGIRHRLVCPQNVLKMVIGRHLKEHGVTFYDPQGMIGVGGVDTLINIEKRADLQTWRNSVTLWVIDECHHGLKKNKWGKVAGLFGNAKKGLGVTATPERPDGQGLGKHVDGLFDVMEVGPGMRPLIDDGYLCPYKVWTIPHEVDYSRIDIGASGEFVHTKLVAAEDCDKKLVGRIVETYQRLAPGLRAVCFMSSVKKAEETAAEFRQAGIASVAVDGNTDIELRAKIMEDLASGKIMVLVNVGVVGEGTDIPDVEVVILGTRTASFVLYAQWWGRGSRLVLNAAAREGYDQLTAAERRARIAASAKPFYRIIDHGGNVIQHNGPPDLRQAPWTLDRRERRGSAPSEALPYRVCTNPGIRLLAGEWGEYRAAGLRDDDLIEQRLAVESELPCAQPYSAIHRDCPFCGYQRFIAARGTPEEVDGDLQLLDADALAALAAARPGTVEDYRQYLYDTGLTGIKVEANVKRHRERLAALGKLGEVMGKWGGVWHSRGETDSQIQRRFYHTFGLDVMSAQALKRADADKLADRVLDATVSGA